MKSTTPGSLLRDHYVASRRHIVGCSVGCGDDVVDADGDDTGNDVVLMRFVDETAFMATSGATGNKSRP